MITRDLDSLIQSLLEGTITPQELQRLEAELIANPRARDLYLDSVEIHSFLDEREFANELKTNIIPIDRVVRRQRKKALRFAAVAALLLISLISVTLLATKQKPPSLTVKVTPDTLFSLTHASSNSDDPPQGMTMQKGSRLQISQGSVELTFKSGVKSIVLAPADITLQEENELTMNEGIAWFHVPTGAEGFQVTTDELQIIDLGTEFGVISSLNNADEVHVFEGKVEITALNEAKEQNMLTKAESLRVDTQGHLTSIQSTPKTFKRELPNSLPHLHVSFDEGKIVTSSNSLSHHSNVDFTLHKDTTQSDKSRFTKGKYDNALSLNGENNYLISDFPGILGDEPRSVAFWLKMPDLRADKDTQSTTRTVIGWGENQSWSTRAANTKFTVHFDHTIDRAPMLNISFGGFWFYCPDVELDDDQWHHVAVTYNGKSDSLGHPITQVYIDGEQEYTEADAHTPIQKDAQGRVPINTTEKTPLVIGANLSPDSNQTTHPNNFLNGQIDELYIIEGAISEKTVRRLMHANELTH